MLQTLPNEILLEIIPYIYTPSSLSSFRLASPIFHELVKAHEQSLAQHILHTQNLRPSLRLFPGLAQKPPSYASLATLHTRLSTLENHHAKWLQMVSHGPELYWLRGRWENIHKAGLLLLHRLQDSGSYNYKVAVLNGLSKTSLACLYFKLISSIKILRVHGPEPVSARFMAGDIMVRSEVELAVEEMLLEHGPAFFVQLLEDGRTGKEEWAVRTLKTEFANMTNRQLPSPDGVPKPPTLTSWMRRAFAARLGCHISQNVSKMWEILSSTNFDEVNEEKLVKIVEGEELKEGMKRVS